MIPLFLTVLMMCSASIFAGGAVASGHPLSTQAGLEVLEKGGNAFDAAVAVAATLNVVEPAMSGLGGYGSTLIYDAIRKEIRYLNSSGRFPFATDSDLMREPTVDYLKNRKGPKSISTPGNLNGWHVMHQEYGKLPWAGLFEQAIGYAKRGFPVSPYIAKLIAGSFDQFSDYAKSFYGKEGRPLQEKDILAQEDLARTYELIASGGVDPFYRGEIAEKMDKQLQELGSFLSIDDLRADVAEWWDPIKICYKGFDVYTMGTPGNGFTALFALGVMGQFPQMNLHILIEVLKESCRVRLRQEDKHHILTQDNFATVARGIDLTKASEFNEHAGNEGMNTTHFVVVDKWGNIVTSTQTLGLGFGSKVMIEGTGIWMNNSMAFSSFEPKGNPMDVFPGQYKISSNSPIIIMKDDLPWAALGTPGGHTIPQNSAQVISNLIDFDMTMQEAIDAPKLAFIEEKNLVYAESGIANIASLKKMGHVIDPNNKIGNAMGVKILPNGYDIGIDKRRDAWHNTHLQLLVVTTNSWEEKRSSMQLFERSNPDDVWTLVGEPVPVVIGKAGMTFDKTEGDWKSPAGTFSLGPVFGFTPSSEMTHLKMDYLELNEYIEAVDDPLSVYYNQIVDNREVTPIGAAQKK